jgi:hypothetical protein
MDSFVARANIDHYITLLNDRDLDPKIRATVIKLLVEEEDGLAYDTEQLEFAETRAAKGRDQLNRVRSKLGASAPQHRAQAERLLANFEATQKLLDGFCHHLRNRVNGRR